MKKVRDSAYGARLWPSYQLKESRLAKGTQGIQLLTVWTLGHILLIQALR